MKNKTTILTSAKKAITEGQEEFPSTERRVTLEDNIGLEHGRPSTYHSYTSRHCVQLCTEC